MRHILILLAFLSQTAHATIILDKHGVPHGTGYIPSPPAPDAHYTHFQAVDLPEEFDLRQMGAVSPIKDQGSCGSCWAFAITENLEDQILRRDMTPKTLAPQQMVSCDGNAYGCGGGSMDDADYAQNPGLSLEKDYPYRAADTRCKRPLPEIAAKAKSWSYVGAKGRSATTTELQQALYQHGSLFVTVSAGGSDWDGRDTMRRCRNSGTNHMVELVGWLKDPKKAGKILFIMRNSWGKDWGDQGFAYMPPGCDELATETGGAAFLEY